MSFLCQPVIEILILGTTVAFLYIFFRLLVHFQANFR